MGHLINLIVAVADDLWSFAYDGVRSAFVREVTPVKTLPAPSVHTQLPEETVTKRLRALTVRPQVSLVASAPNQNTVMYIGVPYANLYKSHDASQPFSAVSYGSLAMVLEVNGTPVRIASGAHEGWVHAEDLADRAAAVYPQFVIGERNPSNGENTARVRAMIEDEFGAGEHDLPLQAEEYVLYKLLRRGVRISWPSIRPRSPGLWHTILRGQSGVRIAVSPVQGGVFEYTEKELGRGHVAYVEALFPDGSMQISEANWPDGGIYNERVLVKEEWQALAPHFIQF